MKGQKHGHKGSNKNTQQRFSQFVDLSINPTSNTKMFGYGIVLVSSSQNNPSPSYRIMYIISK